MRWYLGRNAIYYRCGCYFLMEERGKRFDATRDQLFMRLNWMGMAKLSKVELS